MPLLQRLPRHMLLPVDALGGGEEVRSALALHAQEVMRPQAVVVVGLGVGVVLQLVVNTDSRAVRAQADALGQVREGQHATNALGLELHPRTALIGARLREVQPVGEGVLGLPELVSQHAVPAGAADELGPRVLEQEAAADATIRNEDQPDVGVLQHKLIDPIAVGIDLGRTGAGIIVQRQTVVRSARARLTLRLAEQLDLLNADDGCGAEHDAKAVGRDVQRDLESESPLLRRTPEATGVLPGGHVLPGLQRLHRQLLQLVVVIVAMYLSHELAEMARPREIDVDRYRSTAEDRALRRVLDTIAELGEPGVGPLTPQRLGGEAVLPACERLILRVGSTDETQQEHSGRESSEAHGSSPGCWGSRGVSPSVPGDLRESLYGRPMLLPRNAAPPACIVSPPGRVGCPYGPLAGE